MLYQNDQGINNKLKDLYLSLASKDFVIVALTETWLSESVRNSEFSTDSYTFYCHDSDFAGESRGGGVLLVIRVQLTLLTYEYYSAKSYIISAKSKFCNSQIFLFCAYKHNIKEHIPASMNT